MRITVLGSGSKGNATLFDAGRTRVLVDAGLSARALRDRALQAHGVPLERLDAIVVTHSHGDHVGHVRAVARAFRAPIYVTPATRAAVFNETAPPADLELREYRPDASLQLGALEL